MAKQTKKDKIKYNVKKNKPTKFKLDQIDELKLICIIALPEHERSISLRLEELGGRVVLSKIGEGIGKNMSLEMLGLSTKQSLFVLAVARKSDADNVLVAINSEINFSIPGVGLGFTIDLDGYMGAKGLFL